MFSYGDLEGIPHLQIIFGFWNAIPPHTHFRWSDHDPLVQYIDHLPFGIPMQAGTHEAPIEDVSKPHYDPNEARNCRF